MRIALAILCFASLAAHASAIGIAATPSELTAKVGRGESISLPLTIKNPSREVAIFEVYPEDFDTIITPIPSRFSLESAEEKTVSIKITPRSEGVFSTYLSVVARPITDPVFGIASGVKLPLRITAGDAHTNLLANITVNSALPIALGTLLAAGTILFIVLRTIRRRRAARADFLPRRTE